MSTYETPYAPDNKTRLPMEHYLKMYVEADPDEMSRRTGVPYDGAFHLTVLGEEKTIPWPDFTGKGFSASAQILFIRYLLVGRKTEPSGKFLTYRELPWGEVYDANFRGRCIRRVAATFGARIEDFRRACEAVGGTPVYSSGVGYELSFLPGLYMRLFVWEGEDDIPASAQIQFSDNFHDAFAAEDRVVVCEYLIEKLREASR